MCLIFSAFLFLASCRSFGLKAPSIFTVCPCFTRTDCLVFFSASESWSRSKGRCNPTGQQSTPSSAPLLPTVPHLSRQQKVSGQQHHLLGFGQVSALIVLTENFSYFHCCLLESWFEHSVGCIPE